MGLAAAGVAVLAAGVVIGRWDLWSPSPQAASLQATSPPAAGPVTASSSDAGPAPVAGPGATWLADLKPVGSTSIDEAYAESPWQVAAARVSGVEHRKSISATGAWCSSAQLEFAVDGEYERLTARVAIADDSQLTKALDFYVLADGRRVGEVPDVGMTPQRVDVVVAGASRLTIGVEPTAADGGGCPGPERVGVWVDPSLAKAGPASG
ncbi:NPCBM/NEW2 domain-containing protein [Saccharothrix longispora]|uniref:NPCBM/NEW2 domain-containing protein n=1 Tax=Saccharothrix longispora TaxID=33920 RepID=UPI0028FD1F73|nr:NPCBM/NEW2 domain-containing protein [Saccharothrix longispora]MDU0288100.1 NPCBM/NEW2 domain-containing protein [Saccharothrix longispora]